MKKIVLSILVVAFIVAGVANQSWAMGKRSGGGSNGFQNHQGGSNSGSQSNESDSYSQNFGPNHNDNTNSDNNDNNEHPNHHGESFFYSGNTSNEEFPSAATVPEPATLSLMGMGMAAVLLRRRNKK